MAGAMLGIGLGLALAAGQLFERVGCRRVDRRPRAARARSRAGPVAMSTRTRTVIALAAAAMLSSLVGTPAWAGPTDQLREYTDQVIKILDDPVLARGDRRAAVH